MSFKRLRNIATGGDDYPLIGHNCRWALLSLHARLSVVQSCFYWSVDVFLSMLPPTFTILLLVFSLLSITLKCRTNTFHSGRVLSLRLSQRTKLNWHGMTWKDEADPTRVGCMWVGIYPGIYWARIISAFCNRSEIFLRHLGHANPFLGCADNIVEFIRVDQFIRTS